MAATPGPRRDLRPLRRAHAQPLLRLVRATRAISPPRSAASRRSCAPGSTSTTSRSSSPSTAPTPSPACTASPPEPVDRGVPGGRARDVPPRLRPHRRGRRRADLELRRLRHRARGSCAPTATRRASSPASAGPRPPRTCCGGAGGALRERRAETPAKLRPVQYLGYAAGEVANNLTFQMVSVFLLIYYTDVAGISAATAGTLLLVVRIWGGFTDLLAGRRVDETSTRWGKFRPYLLFGLAAAARCSSWRCSRSPAGSATAARSPGRSSPTRSSRSPTASSTSRTGRWRRR